MLSYINYSILTTIIHELSCIFTTLIDYIVCNIIQIGYGGCDIVYNDGLVYRYGYYYYYKLKLWDCI